LLYRNETSNPAIKRGFGFIDFYIYTSFNIFFPQGSRRIIKIPFTLIISFFRLAPEFLGIQNLLKGLGECDVSAFTKRSGPKFPPQLVLLSGK